VKSVVFRVVITCCLVDVYWRFTVLPPSSREVSSYHNFHMYYRQFASFVFASHSHSSHLKCHCTIYIKLVLIFGSRVQINTHNNGYQNVHILTSIVGLGPTWS